MYKVFIYDKPVLVGVDPDFRIKNYQHFDAIHLKSFLEALQSPQVEGLTIAESEGIWERFQSEFEYIEAAGGLVENEEGLILLIYRLGKWDLPKGKREKGETVRQCAKREVQEECAITNLTVGKELPSTYHCYPNKDGWALKRTYWFKMSTYHQVNLKPQTEEGIEKVIWAPNATIEEAKQNTYQSIIEVLNQLD
jgi:8-oxo-dGTP pyrophosphatase MutT (NUDIX family)